MSKRYIDANKLKKEIKTLKYVPLHLDQWFSLVNSIPTEDVKPTIYANVLVDEDGNIKCSNCGNSECWGNYCMNCGAKMEKRGRINEKRRIFPTENH